MLAIIGGTGMTRLANLEITHKQVVRTPYGEPSGPLTFGGINGHEIIFLARHGYGHTIAPHEVNYRANLWALHQHKVTRIVAVASVGGIRADLKPGVMVLPSQIIDYTYGRKFTYFEGVGKPVIHTDFTEPYCQTMRLRCLKAARQIGVEVLDGGVYAATQGPRLETAAEINRLERDGADMVGMTGMPEAILAKELGISYAAISVVANYAAGRGDSAHGISLEQVHDVLEKTLGSVRGILENIVKQDTESNGDGN